MQTNFSPIIITESDLEVRKNKWLDYFETNLKKTSNICRFTLDCIDSVTLKHKLFTTQSKQEFENSLSFYTQLKAAKWVMFHDYEASESLFNLSLIYGTHPEMVKTSVQIEFKKHPDYISKTTVNNLFNALFINHDIPMVLVDNIENLSAHEIGILFHITQGKNIRSYPSLDLELSKKEAHLFHTLTDLKIDLSEHTLKKYVAICKVIKSKPHDKYYRSVFFRVCKLFSFEIDVFILDIAFWQYAYTYMSNWTFNPHQLTLTSVMDYIEHMRYTTTNFTLKGRTQPSLTRDINAWHRNLELNKLGPLLNTKWKGINKNDSTLTINDNTYSFTQITTGKRLYEEGKTLQHCVTSYIQYCMDGQIAIWNMTESHKDSKTGLTLEISNNEIIQVSGFDNRKPYQNEILAIQTWAKQNNIRYSSQTF